MSAPGPLSRLSLRLRMGLFFAFIAVAGSAGIIGGAVLAASREQGGIALGAFLSVAVLVGISLWVWRLFDENVATPVERAASALTLRARGVAEGDVEVNLGKHLGRLAPAVREVARVLAEQRERERLKLDQRTADLARERRYLSTVLQSLSEGVLVATPDHRITLVNREAGRLLAGEGQIGLDRDLTHLIHRDAIDHALSELSGVPAEGALPDMDLVLSTRADGRFLLARLTLLRDEGGVAGYTLSFRDLTPRIEGARPGAANRREIEVFSTDTLVEGVARALVPELRFRLRGAGGDAGARMIRGDCVALIRLVGALIERIGEVCHGDISVAIGKGQDVPLTLSWDGAALEEPVIEGWRARSLMAAQGAPTVATALEKMGARATFASGKATLLLPDASGMGAVDLDEARPEFFDFDLIGRGAGALADR
ncbi:MAG: PAS domain-containing protein, partial [Rubricella sp.]